MKIALIQPKSFHAWEALNLGYIASFARKNGFEDIRFFSGFFDSDEEIVAGCRDADVVGFSCTSPQMKHAEYLASRIKRSNNHIVFGGVHPSCEPERTLENNDIDAVVAGEGEQAFLEILKGGRDRIIKRPYVEDLDSLPFPDRRLIKQERNIQTAYRDNGIRIASLFSSRGCPFSCVFCASHSVWSRKVRFRSADNILEEFKQVVDELKVDFIKFSDDTFTIKRSLVEEFCVKKIDRRIKTPWACNVRVDMVDEQMLKLMKEAGCREIWAGVESGSPRILKEMNKKITVEQVRRVFAASRELGLIRRAYMLLGMPEETLEDIKLSEALVDEIKPDVVGFTILAPYPGTRYYERGLHGGVDWSVVDEYENRITKTRALSNEDLHTEQARLVEKYRAGVAYRHKPKNGN
ncbi:MAG: B12-binding domain-containing radical SAM protein [Nitrospirae bacterium]|nr:B12-binding domain-containing radical SAM protein [Nitrospirota bacterium]